MKKFVYSGKCRICECGLETGIYDADGTLLKTGDIVLIFATDDELQHPYIPKHLTVVVQNKFTTFGDGMHVPIYHPEKPFVMGIKDVDIANSEWGAVKVKDHADVVHGEHWRAFGFNYREEDE